MQVTHVLMPRRHEILVEVQFIGRQSVFRATIVTKQYYFSKNDFFQSRFGTHRSVGNNILIMRSGLYNTLIDTLLLIYI